MSNVKFLIESLGEEKLFDTVVKITTENLDTYRVAEKWFNIMQNGGRKRSVLNVENQLLEICKSKLSLFCSIVKGSEVIISYTGQ